MQFDLLAFSNQYRRFTHLVKKHSGEPFRSFNTGLANDWEHYKHKLYCAANAKLKKAGWKAEHIGAGSILADVTGMIEVRDRDVVNNLVRWDDRRGHEAKSHKVLLEAKDEPAPRLRHRVPGVGWIPPKH